MSTVGRFQKQVEGEVTESQRDRIVDRAYEFTQKALNGDLINYHFWYKSKIVVVVYKFQYLMASAFRFNSRPYPFHWHLQSQVAQLRALQQHHCS